jgi:16S rRNA (guanine527-N7)-methyltransferase
VIDLQAQAQALFGLTLTPQQVRQFDLLLAELLEWNTRMNLTAITEPQAMQVRHFLDSLSVLPALTDLPAKPYLIDVGTGAGFPGLPLAMLLPHARVTLLDSTKKKLTFVQHAIDALGLQNAHIVHQRAEDAGRDDGQRAKYDVAIARAVARLPSLLEYLLPLTKTGGLCIAMKGSSAQQEADDASAALKLLGGAIEALTPVHLPDVADVHYLVQVRKTHKTPRTYPRRAGLPTKEPLSSK